MGLGAFHRAHQAWYTDQVDPGSQWGIAAFTGRSPKAAEVLAAQDGLYTVVQRTADGDRHELLGSIVEAHDGADLQRFRQLLAADTTAIVTITVTEAAYHVGADGRFDTGAPAVVDDLKLLQADDGHGTWAGPGISPVSTMPARLLLGLQARKEADAGPIAVVSCDNLPGNGAVARAAVLGIAEAVDPELAAWVDTNVSFVQTSVDRITPAATVADVESVEAAQGYIDHTPVVTEPFSSWVLSGDFPAGRPAWEEAGAVFVDDIGPFEDRKLWLLNGAHSLLAYSAQRRGHDTVAQALADRTCVQWVEQFWDEAQRHLPAEGLDIDRYRAALRERFSNARIEHRLAQIASDGSNKLRLRAVPVMKAERQAGRSGEASARMISAWIDYVKDGGTAPDAAAETIAAIVAAETTDTVHDLVQLLDEDLAGDPDALRLIDSLRRRMAPA
nr:mannitol dehydrogenase family protein [Arthrobacter castelli]